MRRSGLSRAPILLTALLLLLAALALAWMAMAGRGQPVASPSESGLHLAVLDVGQGDAIFVRSPAGKTMLVDAGNERADVEKVLIPHLKKHGVSALDYLVLTHPHQDHVGGMPAVLDSLAVTAFVDSAQPGETNQAYLHTLQRVRDKAIKAVKARRGSTEIDLGPGTRVEVLGPEEPLLSAGDSPTNNNSVVLRITHGSVSALLTGDIEAEAEDRLLGHRGDLRSQILKVAHHGSRGSTTIRFLDAVGPEVALISAGANNPYDHPHRELLQRLERRQVMKVYRTDRNGTIQVAVDGQGYRVAVEKQGG